jgi:hypothetical protein
MPTRRATAPPNPVPASVPPPVPSVPPLSLSSAPPPAPLGQEGSDSDNKEEEDIEDDDDIVPYSSNLSPQFQAQSLSASGVPAGHPSGIPACVPDAVHDQRYDWNMAQLRVAMKDPQERSLEFISRPLLIKVKFIELSMNLAQHSRLLRGRGEMAYNQAAVNQSLDTHSMFNLVKLLLSNNDRTKLEAALGF